MNEIKRISFLKTSCQLIFVMFLTFVICFYKAMSCLSCYPFNFYEFQFSGLDASLSILYTFIQFNVYL